MKTRDATYKNLQYRVGTDAYYQLRVVKGGDTYLTDEIVSCDVQQMLCQGGVGVEIGQACASVCTLVLLESSANWERMAKFTVSFRIVSFNATTYTDWIDIGQYYTDTRSEDAYGRLTIVAYDSMLLMEKTWTDSIPSEDLPASFPITARAWATLIQQENLATFDDLTQLNNTVAFVGLDTTSSIRDVLKNIAVVHGGNWTVLANGNLKLIQYENLVDEYPEETDNYIDLGQSEETVETSPPLPAVTGVHLETESGTQMQYGGDTGYMVRAICNVAATSGVPELCLSRVNQFVYKPFTAYNVCIDPAIELGDSVKINGIGYQVMALDLKLQGLITATVSAPYDQEVDHEYAIPNEDAKNYRKTMAAVEEGMSGYVPRDEFESSLVQTERSITASVASTYVTQNDYNEQIAEIQSQLDGAIQSWSGNAVPTLNNAPAVDWTTTADKAEHVGDTYFVNSDAGIPEAGNYYRFENNNGVYSWQLLSDTALTEALAKAAAAQAAAEAAQDSADAAQSTATSANNTAQLKGRIFVVQPTPPYDVGDLWFNSKTSDIRVCMTAKASGQTFAESDWEKRDRYTDDSELQKFINNVYNIAIGSLQKQLDQKAETYYQDTDPAVEWGAFIAGVGVVGIDKVGVWDGSEHEGDLWFRTTDNTTWYFDGGTWVQQSVPDEVFDQIDGKAQIFVSQPYTPYHVGDLWFNGVEDDIKTCTTERLSGDFISGDWVKYNKYTDDTKAKEVEQSLTQFKTTFTVNPEDIRAEVEKRVIANKTETVNSFGWKLLDTGHIWYANNNEVARINQSGAYIKGEIRATTGYIGDETNGFAIGSKYIRNGMTELADTTHNGVYVGTDGIALGKGSFRVTSAGVLTARRGYIGNGSSGFQIGDTYILNGMTSLTDTSNNGIYLGTNGIALGKGNFKVTNTGEVTAKNLNITGGSIKLGGTTSNPVFSVASTGAVTASNLNITGGSISIKDTSGKVIFSANSSGVTVNGDGTFTGNIYAKNIQYGGTAGTLSGSAITPQTISGTSSSGTQGQIKQGSLRSLDIAQNTITGGSGGNLAQHTLSDLNVVSSGYSPSALNSAIQGTLTSAGTLALGLKSSTASQLGYFAAKSLYGTSSVASRVFSVESSSGDELYHLNDHYHSFVESDGKIVIGIPHNDISIGKRSFNIADTQTYKDGVKAEKVTSLDITYQYDADMRIYKMWGTAKNSAGTVVYETAQGSPWNTDRSAYIAGQSAGEAAEKVTSIDISYSYDYTLHVYKLSATAYNKSGSEVYSTSGWNTDRSAYIDGQNSGTSYTNYIYTASEAWTTRNGHPLCRVSTVVYGVTSSGSYVQLASGTVDYERPY